VSTEPLSPSRQVVFHQMLVAARKSVLMDALSETLGELDPNVAKKRRSAWINPSRPACRYKIGAHGMSL
jgi:hypothetical protein